MLDIQEYLTSAVLKTEKMLNSAVSWLDKAEKGELPPERQQYVERGKAIQEL